MEWQLLLDPGIVFSKYGIEALQKKEEKKFLIPGPDICCLHIMNTVVFASLPSFVTFASSTSWAWVHVVRKFSICTCGLTFIIRRTCMFIYLHIYICMSD